MRAMVAHRQSEAQVHDLGSDAAPVGELVGTPSTRALPSAGSPPTPRSRTFTSSDLLVADVANALEQAMPGRILDELLMIKELS